MALQEKLVIISYADFEWSYRHNEMKQIEDKFAVFNFDELYEALVEDKEECQAQHEEAMRDDNYPYTVSDYVYKWVDQYLNKLTTTDNDFEIEFVSTVKENNESRLHTIKYCVENADPYNDLDAEDLFEGKVKPVTQEFIAHFKK